MAASQSSPMDWEALPAILAAQGKDLPPASRLLGGIVVGLSLLHVVASSFVDELLALVPHHTIFSPVVQLPVPFFWNLVTGHLFEGYFFKALLMAPSVVALTQLLETLWSVRSILLHVAFTAACSSFVVMVVEVVEVIQTSHYKEFFMPVQGTVGLVVALSVGLRHAYPFEPVPLLPRAWNLQCQHLPCGIAAVFSGLGLLFRPTWLPEWPFAPLALCFGWLYIRYFMWFPYAGAYGDHSPDFSFAALFPNALRPPAAFIGAVVFNLVASVVPGLVRLRQQDATVGNAIVYDPTRALEDGTAMRLPGPGVGLNGAAAADDAGDDTERAAYNARRAKALKLLDDNLASLLSGTASAAASAMGGAASPPPADDVDFAAPTDSQTLAAPEGKDA